MTDLKNPQHSEKFYIQSEELLQDSFSLGLKVIESGFRPDFIVAVWRGGTPVGIAVQELMKYVGIATDHIAIRTSYYDGIDVTQNQVQVHNLGYLVENLNYDNSVLIVDDVFDRGRSIEAIIAELRRLTRRNLPKDIRIATVWFKPEKNVTALVPDYYVHETNQWLIFPHELEGLPPEEVVKCKPTVADLVVRAMAITKDSN